MHIELKEQPMIAYNTFKNSEEDFIDNNVPIGSHIPPRIGEYSYFIYVPMPIPMDELPMDRLPMDRLSRDRLPRDELPRDELPRDELPRDELPRDELTIYDKWIIETAKSKPLSFQIVCHYSLSIDVPTARRPINHFSHGKIIKIVKKIDADNNTNHKI